MKIKTMLPKPDKMLFKDYLFILAGCILYPMAIVLFTSPNDIAPGGIIGISTMLNYLFDFIPIGTASFVLNIPVFLAGALVMGWGYLARSLIATGLSSVVMDVMKLAIDKGIISPYQGDGMLAAIFGGLLCGTGLALIFYCGGSTGGTDIVSRILHVKKPQVSQGKAMLMVDAVVITISIFVYGNIENALYAIICIFVNSKVVDAILYGFSRNNGKLLFIVTAKYDEVTDAILNKIDRGVTLLNAEGGYRRDSKRVLLCAVRPHQVHQTNVLVHELDPDAFIIITTANTIKGKGFYSYDEAPNPSVHISKPEAIAESGENTTN